MSNAEQNTQQLQHKVNYSKQTNIKKNKDGKNKSDYKYNEIIT